MTPRRGSGRDGRPIAQLVADFGHPLPQPIPPAVISGHMPPISSEVIR